MLLSAPDSLVVSIAKNHGFDGDEQLNTVNFTSTPHKSHARSSGIDGLDLLKFTYKVYSTIKNLIFYFIHCLSTNYFKYVWLLNVTGFLAS